MEPNLQKAVIYLDHNVIAQLASTDSVSPLERVLIELSKLHFEIPFSTSHINEIVRISGADREERINSHLKILSKISQNRLLDFRDGLGQYTIRDSEPSQMYKEFSEAEPHLSKMFDALRLIKHDDLRLLRKTFNIDSSKINQMNPSEAIDYIDLQIKLKTQDNGSSAEEDILINWLKENNVTSFSAMIDQSIETVKKIDATSITDYTLQVMHFSLLESFGYQSQKKNKYDAVNSFYDYCHSAIARDCAIFVSEDDKMLKRMGGAGRKATQFKITKKIPVAVSINQFLHLIDYMFRDNNA